MLGFYPLSSKPLSGSPSNEILLSLPITVEVGLSGIIESDGGMTVSSILSVGIQPGHVRDGGLVWQSALLVDLNLTYFPAYKIGYNLIDRSLAAVVTDSAMDFILRE